ncbi:MAG: thioredoxin family protein [Thermoguttaceae bacterium]|nr:thioredoxin family protein [Thermoguttaceae bacterium]
MKRSLWFRMSVSALIVAGIVCVYLAKNHAKHERMDEVVDEENYAPAEVWDVKNGEAAPSLYDGINDVVPADPESERSESSSDANDGEIVLPMLEENDEEVVFASFEQEEDDLTLIKEVKWVEPSETKGNESPRKDLTGADFRLRATRPIDFDALASYGLPVVVDYGADACLQCKRMAPVLEQANKTYRGKAFIKFVNVWDYPKAAKNAPVQLIPTQVFFDAGGKPFKPSVNLSAEIEFQKRVGKDANKRVFTIHQGELTKEQLEKILAEMGAKK